MSELPNNTLLKPSTVAEYFQVSKKTIYLWVSVGKLDGVKLGGKTLRVTRESVDRLHAPAIE